MRITRKTALVNVFLVFFFFKLRFFCCRVERWAEAGFISHSWQAMNESCQPPARFLCRPFDIASMLQRRAATTATMMMMMTRLFARFSLLLADFWTAGRSPCLGKGARFSVWTLRIGARLVDSLVNCTLIRLEAIRIERQLIRSFSSEIEKFNFRFGAPWNTCHHTGQIENVQKFRAQCARIQTIFNNQNNSGIFKKK